MKTFSADVTNTSDIVLPANPNRQGFILINNHASVDIYVAPHPVTSGATASATGGLLLKAAGANKITARDFAQGDKSLTVYTGPVYAICGSSSVIGIGEG